MNMNKDIIESLYQKAITSFHDCMKDEENAFLRDEINLPVSSIIPRGEFVKIQFFQSETSKFIIEVKIQLLFRDVLIGYYCYFEDEAGLPIDDKLVFD